MVSKETKRWLKAIEIAKVLFEEQGYHCRYLEGIENFIWRKAMYSPKIREDLVPLIYQTAKAKRIKMTTLVNRILEQALNGGSPAPTGMKEGNQSDNPRPETGNP